MKNLNELAQRIHKLNHKWWHDEHGNRLERNQGELLMLVITELAEAVEGIRKDLMDDKLPHRKMEEVEMADAKIRLLDFAAGFNLDLGDNSFTGRLYKPEQTQCEKILVIVNFVMRTYHHRKEPKLASYFCSFAILSIEHYCANAGLDLEGAMEEKISFNRTREDHTHEARKLAGGKKF